MVDISGQLPNQQVNVPTDYNTLGQQAFNTQVEPLREGFQKNLTGTLESLSQRGVMFGEVGSENVQNLLNEQGKRETQLASQIGTSMGLTQLEQAFQSSEAAKTRELQRELSLAGFEFQSGESEAQREYGREMTQVGQGFQAGQTQQQQTFSAQQADLDRQMQEAVQSNNIQAQQDIARLQAELQGGLVGQQQDFQREQTAGQQTFVSQQADLDRQMQSAMQSNNIQAQQDIAKLQSDLQIERTNLQQEFQREMETQRIEANQGTLDQQLAFQEKMTRLEQEFQGDEAEAQRTFAGEQALLGRTLTQSESALQREFNQALAVGDFDGQKTMEAKQFEYQRQAQIAEAALNLALSGNLDKETAQQMLGDLLGQDISLTTEDELAMQRVAAASGVSVADYTKMRQAIGKGQMADMFATDMGRIDAVRLENLPTEALSLLKESKILDASGNLLGDPTEFITKVKNMKTDQDVKVYLPFIGADVTVKKLKETFSPELLNSMENAYKNRVTDPNQDGYYRNLSNYISTPGSQLAFQKELANQANKHQLELARINAKAMVDSANAGRGGGKVLCTELYHQGLLPDYIYKADSEYAKTMDISVVSGYHRWAIPLVKVMQQSKIVAYMLKPFITAWAYHMAYKMNVVTRDNYLGAFLEFIGVPICRVLGNKEVLANG